MVTLHTFKPFQLNPPNLLKPLISYSPAIFFNLLPGSGSVVRAKGSRTEGGLGARARALLPTPGAR